MRRRKATTMQINVRLDTAVVDQLETFARARRVSFSEEARQRIVDSLSLPSLDEFRFGWLSRVRGVVEAASREDPEAAKDIESTWRVLQRLDAKFAHFCTEVATELDLPDSKVRVSNCGPLRELLWGAPTLPDGTKARGQS